MLDPIVTGFGLTIEAVINELITNGEFILVFSQLDAEKTVWVFNSTKSNIQVF